MKGSWCSAKATLKTEYCVYAMPVGVGYYPLADGHFHIFMEV